MHPCLLAATLIALALTAHGAPGFADLNRAFGLPIWADNSLWDDAETAVAQRLGWKQESQTKTQSSYRQYPGESLRVLGARPYSLALFCDQTKPSQLSMVFANRGDFGGLAMIQSSLENANSKALTDLRKREREALRDFPKALETDAAAIGQHLAALLGPGTEAKFGASQQLREHVRRWDWQGHAILLSLQRDQYVSVRILPTTVADQQGRGVRVNDAELRRQLSTRVVTRPNGDVIITDLPMTDQGPKGFCVPATMERVLRYMGINADMYVLAMAGGSGRGGGTYTREMEMAVGELVRSNLRQVVPVGSVPKINTIARTIDAGLPLMWTMFVVDDLNRSLNERAKSRKLVIHWAVWMKVLEPMRKAVRRVEIDRTRGHMCLIIGYNKRTGELAISDSWGPDYAERWITEEEALAINGGSVSAISW